MKSRKKPSNKSKGKSNLKADQEKQDEWWMIFQVRENKPYKSITNNLKIGDALFFYIPYLPTKMSNRSKRTPTSRKPPIEPIPSAPAPKKLDSE